MVRLTRISRDRVDTAEVTVLHTQARAQHDNTVIRPRPLYYWYLLVRDGSGWRIAEARRGTPDLRTA